MDDDYWARRERLWQQLLDGELTEVFQVAGQEFISWRFGLEPIDVVAYRYDAAGIPISSAERERIGRELSAQRCWAVHSQGIVWTEHSPLMFWAYQGVPLSPLWQGGVTTWDRLFIDRAQIALIILRTKRAESFLRSVRALRRSMRNRSGDERGFAADVEYDRTQIEFHRRLKNYSLYYSMRFPPRPPYGFVVARYLLDRYPEKTLIVSSPQEIAQLGKLRIPRERRQDG